ncbi:MAG: T9SS type A sorting domain-containing protein [Bacteroidales bacterium]|nr:T9SS type A sorting domain-containing protein [Bacteroidales bacterium]
MLNYEANGIVGSIENPYPISFRRHSVIALPSPFVDKVQIMVSDEENLPVSVNIYSAGGQLLAHADGQIENGTYTYLWQAGASVPAGIYSAVVRVSNRTQTVKLIKQ